MMLYAVYAWAMLLPTGQSAEATEVNACQYMMSPEMFRGG
jgi:hypothetical protein